MLEDILYLVFLLFQLRLITNETFILFEQSLSRKQKILYFPSVIMYKMHFLFRMNETDICQTDTFMKGIMFFFVYKS